MMHSHNSCNHNHGSCPPARCGQVCGNLYFCTGSCGYYGSLWGSNPYTADSGKCAAAKHAGYISKGGYFRVNTSSGLSNYYGSSRNGLNSNNYGSYGSTITICSAWTENIICNNYLISN